MINIENESCLEEKEQEIRLKFIVDQFACIGLDIQVYPELFERFKHLHSPESKHFEDAVQMTEIINAIWNELETKLPFKLNKEQLFLATLLHDVGKSGPKEATPAEQELIVTLFNPRRYQAIQEKGERIEQMPIFNVLQASDINDSIKKKIADYLLNNLGIDIAKERMIDFWRRHADWTFDILSKNQGGKITQEIVRVASSHHILDGKNPACLDCENIPGEAKTIEIIESYEILILVDKFQAFVQRSGLSHDEAVAVLRQIIGRQNLSEKVKGDYLAILDVIEQSKDKLQAILKS